MLFVLKESAMNGSEQVLNHLDAIVKRVEDEVHEADLIDADQLEDSTWYQTSRPLRQKLLMELAEASLYQVHHSSGPHQRRIEVHNEGSAERAERLAHTPLFVLAENRGTDGTLVQTALRTFGDPRTQTLCFGAPSRLALPAMRIDSGGGHGELKKLVAKHLEEAQAVNLPPRLVVVTDSDGEWPGEVKSHAQEIRDQCAGAKVPCPPLNKRTAENYIPDVAWQAWVADPSRTSARPAVAALMRLSPEQRDHVHMAAPETSPWDSTKPKADALFASPPVSAADRDLLKQASLKGRGDHMLIFILRDHAAVITREGLAARDHRGDLQELVRQIEQEL